MVYVDNYLAPYRGMLMSHMVADTTDELLKMADDIGLSRKYIQYPGTHREHFDVCQIKRKLAIELGAIPVDVNALVEMRKKSRSK